MSATGNLCGACQMRPADSMHEGRAGAMRCCAVCHDAMKTSYGCRCEACRKDKTMSKKKANGHASTTTPRDLPTGAVERNRYDEKLPCKTDADVTTAKALELAKLEHQRTAFREAWKAQCAKARERRAYFEERIEELANEVEGQVEYRNVQVVEYLLPTNEVLVVRGDTGEVIETRAADADDLQETIPGSNGSDEASAP